MTAGRRMPVAPRRPASAGQSASAPNPIPAAMPCARGATSTGSSATASVAAPPIACSTRARPTTGRSPAAVTTCATPVTASPAVMIHGSVAVDAASALIVSCTGSKDGCRAAARVQPPIMATGAAIADASAQRGTVMCGLSARYVGDWVRDRPPRRMGAGLRGRLRRSGPRSCRVAAALPAGVELPRATTASLRAARLLSAPAHPARPGAAGARTTTCRRRGCRGSSPAASPGRSAARAVSSRTVTESACARRRRRSGAGPRPPGTSSCGRVPSSRRGRWSRSGWWGWRTSRTAARRSA